MDVRIANSQELARLEMCAAAWPKRTWLVVKPLPIVAKVSKFRPKFKRKRAGMTFSKERLRGDQRQGRGTNEGVVESTSESARREETVQVQVTTVPFAG